MYMAVQKIPDLIPAQHLSQYNNGNSPFGEEEFLINKLAPLFPPLHFFTRTKQMYFLEGIYSQYDHFHKGGRFMFFLGKYLPLQKTLEYHRNAI